MPPTVTGPASRCRWCHLVVVAPRTDVGQRAAALDGARAGRWRRSRPGAPAPAAGRSRGRAPGARRAPTMAGEGRPVCRLTPVARPLDAGGHLGLVLAVAGDDEGDAVGQRLLHAAVAPVGDHDVDVGQQEVVGDEALQAHVRRQAPPQRLGVGPAGGGDDEQVVVAPGRGSSRSSSRPRSALSSVPWVTWTTGRPPSSSPHHAGCSKDCAGGARMGPTKRTDGREVRARVLEAGHRRLQVGVDHLGLEVDEVAGEPPAAPASASRRRAKRWMSASTTCSVAQFMARVAQPAQRSRPGLEGHPERRGVPAVRRVGHDADAGERGPVRPRAQREGEGAEEHGVDHDAVGGEVLEDGAQVAALAGQRADEDPAQVVLHAAHARAWTTTRARGWPP